MRCIFNLTHRNFIASLTVVGLLNTPVYSKPVVVNDIHSQLNETRVLKVEKPTTLKAVQKIIKGAKKKKQSISIAGGRHAMGGQQFGEGTVLIDTNGLNKVLRFDEKKGIIEVEAGIQWPKLINYLIDTQKGKSPQWGIRQKQTGADRLTIGGALSANVHGRGLTYKPFVGDVESFTLVDANGDVKTCSRDENKELFGLVIGGYGLFGVIYSVELRLDRRTKIERVVEVIDLKDFNKRVNERIKDGFLYGDLQYSTDMDSENFLSKGVFSCYKPVSDDTEINESQKSLSADDWKELYYLGHADQAVIWEMYSSYYLSTHGQIYWSDTHQLSEYVDYYHDEVSKRLGEKEKATEMITEIYVDRDKLVPFMDDVKKFFRENKTQVIYGTIRLIEKDDESFLAWAKKSYMAIIFNLHVVHTDEGFKKAKKEFRTLIDLGMKYGGSYFPTYHTYARKDQVLKCYPQFPEFLKRKLKYDPQERFQSNWYRFYKKMFREERNEAQ